MTMRTAKCRARVVGFTLLELLATVAVIAILAALLMGAVAFAKRKAHNVNCVSNERQIGLALIQFLGDAHVYPLFVNPQRGASRHSQHGRTWQLSLHRYTDQKVEGTEGRDPGQSGIWRCPEAIRPATLAESEPFISYGYNAHGLSSDPEVGSSGLGGKRTPDGIVPVSESEVADPANMIAVGDGFTGSAEGIKDGTAIFWRKATAEGDAASTERASKRHGGSANILFADGHVESLSLEELFRDSSPEALRRWTRDGRTGVE